MPNPKTTINWNRFCLFISNIKCYCIKYPVILRSSMNLYVEMEDRLDFFSSEIGSSFPFCAIVVV